MSLVGKSIPHDSARGHVTGEARYIEDLPRLAGELAVAFAVSPCARGRLRSLALEETRRAPGVAGAWTARDLPGHNRFGAIFADEPALAEDRVDYVGQPVAVIAADSPAAARRAARLARMEIEDEPPVFSIEEALARGEFIGPRRRIARGDFEAAWAAAPRRLEGVFQSGGQEQFYFESQAALAIPEESGRLRILCSTQNPTEMQLVAAETLGLRMNEVVCECRRLGGGFGGKETQFALPAIGAALAALKTGRPARIVYRKDEDMRRTGKRHAFRTDWKAAFDEEGRILALRVEFHSNGGAFADLSTAILERAMLHAENAYYIPNVEIVAQVCRTNLPPNTAFRGFGGPQGVAAMENIIEEIAAALGRDSLEIRRRNLYGGPGRDTTPYGQRLEEFALPEIFDRLEASSNYQARRAEIERHNAVSKTTLCGIALTPVKFGISFTTRFLNQGNALVHVYTDGTVQVSTGGAEMGQGLNTKIRQLVADEFGLPLEAVIVMTTSTEKNINTPPTAASAGTDLNGMAAVNACRQIRERLARFAAARLAAPGAAQPPDPDEILFENSQVFARRDPARRIAFADLCGQAWRERVDLGARGFYATPGVDFNRETGQGTPFFYFTTGAAVAEVAVDRFTGALKIERVDLLMDIGRRINPGIDRGQVIGGFVQGVGWVTTECLVYSPSGELLSDSPTTYKIPAINDIPAVFHVDFFENELHQRNVAASKAVGEPPLLLGISVWAAVKRALSSRAPAGRAAPLGLPATNEEILLRLTALERS